MQNSCIAAAGAFSLLRPCLRRQFIQLVQNWTHMGKEMLIQERASHAIMLELRPWYTISQKCTYEEGTCQHNCIPAQPRRLLFPFYLPDPYNRLILLSEPSSNTKLPATTSLSQASMIKQSSAASMIKQQFGILHRTTTNRFTYD